MGSSITAAAIGIAVSFSVSVSDLSLLSMLMCIGLFATCVVVHRLYCDSMWRMIDSRVLELSKLEVDLAKNSDIAGFIKDK